MRVDPVTRDEYALLVASVRQLKIYRGSREEPAPAAYLAVLGALYETGCHPSVIAANFPPSRGPWIDREPTEGGWVLRWKRPKTGKFCQMPVSDDLQVILAEYLAGPRYSRRQIHNIIRKAADAAGLGPLSALTFRHTAGLRAWKVSPAVARDSLGVGAKTLEFYTVLSDPERIRALRSVV